MVEDLYEGFNDYVLTPTITNQSGNVLEVVDGVKFQFDFDTPYAKLE